MPRASTALTLCLALAAGAAHAKETKKPSAGEARRAAAATKESPEERYIEKRSGEYLFKLTLRPGELQPGRVANVNVEILRLLEIPDPQWGDRLPMKGSRPVAVVQAPAKESRRNRRRTAPAPSRYVLWPITNPGEFGFHFSPAHDGLYTLSISGVDPTLGDALLDASSYEVSFRIGVGSESAQTEQSQGTAAARRTARRPVGLRTNKDAARQLQDVMEEVGERFLDLEDLLDNAPRRGANKAAAAEARALAALFAKTKGLTPRRHKASSEEFQKLAAGMPALLEAVAVAAEGKDRKAPRAAFEKAEIQGCLQCHTKFRWDVTKSVAAWPAFESIDWTKNEGSR